ncbi:MAG: XRE family transcriptional regulator [Steroidobacteraceae bacterium]
MLTAAQCRAARALLDASLETLSKASAVDVQAIRSFEQMVHEADDEAQHRLRRALEAAGVVFIAENGGGAGVRLKYNRRDVRAIRRWEGEGGITAPGGG